MRTARWSVQPGWWGRVPAELEVVVDQAAALVHIEERADRELWCARQQREWTVMLTAMVWRTGPVARPRRCRSCSTGPRTPDC
jgi:hypothetical protein